MPLSTSSISLARRGSARHDLAVTPPDSKPPRAKKLDQESVPARTRRTFTAAEKLKILDEADACPRGEQGELLRRHGIYSSHLVAWRKQLRLHGREGLGPRKPGRKSRRDDKDDRIAELEKKLARTEKQLSVAKSVIEFQKKVAAMLDDESEGES